MISYWLLRFFYHQTQQGRVPHTLDMPLHYPGKYWALFWLTVANGPFIEPPCVIDIARSCSESQFLRPVHFAFNHWRILWSLLQFPWHYVWFQFISKSWISFDCCNSKYFRLPVNSSHDQLVKKSTRHSQLITWSSRHIVLVNSSNGQLGIQSTRRRHRN